MVFLNFLYFSSIFITFIMFAVKYSMKSWEKYQRFIKTDLQPNKRFYSLTKELTSTIWQFHFNVLNVLIIIIKNKKILPSHFLVLIDSFVISHQMHKRKIEYILIVMTTFRVNLRLWFIWNISKWIQFDPLLQRGSKSC